MEKIQYPLLCFELNEESYLGLLVGTEYSLVERTPRKLKSVLTAHLQKVYKREGDYPYLEMSDPVMRMIEIDFRPTYRHNNTAYPLKAPVKVVTPLVYGEEEPGVYDCFLPVFNENFYCYDLRQLDSLAKHFVKTNLDAASPEDVYRFSRYPVPEMEIVNLKVDDSDSYSHDWNQAAKPEVLERLAERYPLPKAIQRNLSPLPDAAWGREELVVEAVGVLYLQQASLLLVGETGVGKSAVLRATFRSLQNLSKQNDSKRTFWRIRAQRFTATSKYVGQWQEKVEELVNELSRFNGILWVEDIVQLVREGSGSVENSVAAYLLPFLHSGKLQLVGEVTPEQLDSLRRFLPGFVESMQLIEIEEMTEKKNLDVFQKMQEYVSTNLSINIKQDALQDSLRLLGRFYPYEKFPGKGVRFLGEVISDLLLSKKLEMNRQDVLRHFVRRTGLPELFLRDDIILDQTELRQFFDSKIIGQPAAIDRLSEIVKVFKAGLNNPYKPITTLIFAGPTGVGKTASARALAQYFFGKGQTKDPLIRIDMSEFQHPSQITRFLGSGRDVGKLVADVRERPFAVLLLDEAEKAASSIFDAFLSVLDEGRLVDAFGRVTNFRNCIIILTTNLGASNQNSIGFTDTGGGEAAYRHAIGRFFRPEFINRIDNIVVFNPLGREEVKLIAKKELDDAKKREGFVKKGLEINFDSTVIDYLADIGFHEKYGARPLQRALEDHILKPMATWMLKNSKVENRELKVSFENRLKVNFN